MRIFSLVLTTILTISLFGRSSQADIITLDLVADDQVTLGNPLSWSLFATVSDYDSLTAENWGIDAVAVDMFDAGGNTLTPGTIGAPFADYDFPFGGDPSGGPGSLIEIGAGMLTQDSGVVEAADPAFGGTDSGPLLLASGSFTPTSLGTFDLTITAGSANTFFTGQGDFTGTGEAFTAVFNSDSYTVVNIPEPNSAIALLSFLLAGVALHRRKRF